jgi:hypothetical protein
MLIVVVNCMHKSAHAMQDHVKASGDQASLSQIYAPHQCPCVPLEQHEEHDVCDTCINCACHAPLGVQQLVISYNPIVLKLHFSDPYQYLPEVFLSKFVPPQIQA